MRHHRAGDGKLGLLVAQVLACHAPGRVTLFGRHTAKMALVQGLAERLVVDEHTASKHAAAFDLVVEAAGEQQHVHVHAIYCRHASGNSMCMMLRSFSGCISHDCT